MNLGLVLEEFVTGFINRHNSEYVEVFANPSKKQIDSVAEEYDGKKYIRYMADGKEKKLYIFPPSVLHLDVVKEIGSEGYFRHPSRYFYLMGIGVKENGKWVSKHSNSFSATDSYDKEFVEEVLDAEWDWTKRYHLNVDPLLNRMKKHKSVYNDDLESSFMAQ